MYAHLEGARRNEVVSNVVIGLYDAMANTRNENKKGGVADSSQLIGETLSRIRNSVQKSINMKLHGCGDKTNKQALIIARQCIIL